MLKKTLILSSRLLLVVLGICFAQLAFAQTKVNVVGRIVDEHGAAVIGAAVLEQGTTNGAVSDSDGNFTISVNENATLFVSSIGYSDQTANAGKGGSILITLAEESTLLDETVVIGYGSQKKVNVIGSIATVDSGNLESRSVADVSNMLTGLVSGVTITQTSGNPGADSGTIRVRGVGSFGATPSALVLIDGMPGSLSDLSSADIESISVLKDAASAAIYGSRSANGVILVTTKKGNEGKTHITYNGTIGMNQATKLPEFAHSYEYAEYYNMAVGTETYTAAMIQAMKDGSDPDNYADEMYLEDILGGHAVQTKHELSVSGGNSKVQYMASFAYLYQGGLLEKNDYNRYNARINLNVNLAKNLDLSIRASGMAGDRREPSTPGALDVSGATGIISQALRYVGMYPTYTSTGEVGLGPTLQGTAVAWMNCNSFYTVNNNNYDVNAELAWKPVKGLTFKGIFGYDYSMTETRDYRADLTLTGDLSTGPSSLTDYMYHTTYKTFQGLADYSTTFGKKHNFSALLGYTWEDESQRTLSGSRNSFPSDDVPYLTAGGADGQTNTGGGYDWAIQSFFGRVSYNYDERYLVEGTIRFDGSSRFPTSSRFGTFPSVAVGWRVSQENFWKDNPGLSWFNQLKIKASYGVLGNNNIGNYPYQSVYALGSSLNYVLGGTYSQGAAVTTYVDSDLKWERTATFDVGIETSFFNGELTFNASYYRRNTTDILYQPSASYSAIFGLDISEVNTGEVSNNGYELEIGHQNRVGEFNYHVSANLTYVKNRVKTLGMGNVTQTNGMVGNGSDLFIGYPMNMFYGYKTDGVFLTDAEVSDWYDQSEIAPNSQAGDIRYVDITGDGLVTEEDKTYLGSSIPRYSFGFNLGFDWKGIDFNVLFQGVAGVKGTLSTYAGYAFYQDGNIQKWQMEGCWDVQQDNRYPDYPRLETLTNAGSNNTLTSDWWVVSSAFVKVRNIQVGYSFPKKIAKKIGAEVLRVYVTFDNPFTFTSYRKGWDPEKSSNNGQYYPTLSTYSFGLTLKF